MKDDEGIYIYIDCGISYKMVWWKPISYNLDFPIGSTEYVIINYMCIDLMIISIGYQTMITVL